MTIDSKVLKSKKYMAKMIITEVKRDATVTIKISSQSPNIGQLVLMINNNTFKISIISSLENGIIDK